MPYQLRYLLPLSLLLMTALLAGYNYLRSSHLGNHHIEEHAYEEMAHFRTLLNLTLKQAVRQPDARQLGEMLEILASSHSIDKALVLGKNNIPVAATTLPVSKNGLDQLLAPFSSDFDLQQHRKNSDVLLDTSRNNMLGIFPLSTNIVSDPSASSTLLLIRDLKQEKAARQLAVRQEVIEHSLILLAFILGIWAISYKYIAARLIRLLAATRRIAAGNTDTRVRVYGEDELGIIARAIDNMAIEFDRHQAQIRSSEEKVRLLLESTAEGLFSIDTRGLCTLANPASAKLLGYQSPNDLLGKNMHALIHHSHEDGTPYPADDCPVSGTITTGKGSHTEDEVFWKRDGSAFAVEYWSYPICKDEKIVGVVVCFLDISKRKHDAKELRRHQFELEELVEERTNNLKIANEELKSFAYSVSHDLRAPLRAVRGFLHALEEEYGGQLAPEGRNYLLRAIKASYHMNELISDMLILSRVVHSDLNPVCTDLSRHIENIIENLKNSQPERHVETIITPGINALADKNLVFILLQNLVENAWKFTRHKKHARIEFGRAQIGQNNIYYIRDNGAGFDMEYAEKLFKPFQRLHSEAEFEGTGIGLATCRRIVEKHSGQVWINSADDEGTTVYFTLNCEPQPSIPKSALENVS